MDAVPSPHTGKYQPLWRWLRDRSEHKVRLSFEQVEDILEFGLPPSSRNHSSHWYG